jgi:hypothetical protein
VIFKKTLLFKLCKGCIGRIIKVTNIPTSHFFLILHGHETGSHIQGKTWAEGLHEQHAKKDIWVTGLEKTA